MLWTLLAAAALLYLACAAILYAAQRRMLFVPDTARPVLAGAGAPGLREVTLQTADGLALLAWYLPPPEGRPILVYFHGNAGSLGNRGPRIRRFAAAGWGVLMTEYRGYGGNPGTPSEAGFALDARAAIAFLDAQPGPRPQRLVYGESIGTGVAVRVASETPIDALILESPYTSIADIARRRFRIFPVDLLLRDPFDSLSRIGQVQAPILILQGLRDGIVPPDLGQALYRAAPDPKQLWQAPEAGHNDLMQHGAAEATIDFVRRLDH